jgi:hypothetical protein
MTLGEFRTFLEGFEHAFVDGVPSAEQWALIKAKIEEVTLIKPVIPTPPYVPSIKDVMTAPAKVWYGAGDDPKMTGGAR